MGDLGCFFLHMASVTDRALFLLVLFFKLSDLRMLSVSVALVIISSLGASISKKMLVAWSAFYPLGDRSRPMGYCHSDVHSSFVRHSHFQLSVVTIDSGAFILYCMWMGLFVKSNANGKCEWQMQKKKRKTFERHSEMGFLVFVKMI